MLAKVRMIMEDHGILADKRVSWQREIRRRDIESMFTKRRKELIVAEYSSRNSFNDDVQQLEAVIQIINSLPGECFVFILRRIIQMDHTLNLLFSVTGLVPERVPQFYSGLIRQLRQNNTQIPQVIHLSQNIRNSPQNHFQIQNLREIICEFQKWQQKNGRYFERVVSLLNHLTNFDLAIDQRIIEYFCLIINIFLVVIWVAQSIKELKGELSISVQKLQNYLNCCLLIMTNILAGEDQKLIPYIHIFVHSLGGHIRCIGLYFNLFLIKGIAAEVKLELFGQFIRVVSLNTEQYMQDHREITYILINFFKNMSSIPKELQSSFNESGQKLVSLLSQILKVLNLRYESMGIYLQCLKINNQQQDVQFIYHVSTVLNQLASHKELLRSIVQSSSIMKFIINNIQTAKSKLQTKILINLLHLLSKVTNDHYAYDCFFYQPRIIKKLLKLFGVWGEIQFQQKEFLAFVNQLLFVLSIVCTHQVLFQKCLKAGIFEKLNHLYFTMLNGRIVVQTRYECKYLFINLMIGARGYLTEHGQDRNEVLDSIFGEKKTVYLFVEVLKEKRDRKFFEKGIQLLSFLIGLQESLDNRTELTAFLDDVNILSTLQNIQNTNDRISQSAVRGIYIIRKRRERLQRTNEMQM